MVKVDKLLRVSQKLSMMEKVYKAFDNLISVEVGLSFSKLFLFRRNFIKKLSFMKTSAIFSTNLFTRFKLFQKSSPSQ